MPSLDAPRSLLFSELTSRGQTYGAIGAPPPRSSGYSQLPLPGLVTKTQTASKRQRHVRALTVRERLNLPPEESPLDGTVTSRARNVLAAYANVEDYDTQRLVEALPGRAVMIGDVATIAAPTSSSLNIDPNSGPPIAFFFPYGCAVLWGFTEVETEDILSFALSFTTRVLDDHETSFDCMGFEKIKPTSLKLKTKTKMKRKSHSSPNLLYSKSLTEGEVDMLMGGGGGGSAAEGENDDGSDDDEVEEEASVSPKMKSIHSDHREQDEPDEEEPSKSAPVVHFMTSSAGVFGLSDTMDPLAKLSVSYAFAQSAKLETLENGVDVLVEDLRPIPEQLAKTGRCNFSSRDVARTTGRAFLLSSSANLYSDILDEPDFFWEQDAYLPLYTRTSAYLDVDDRMRILNSRLDVVQKLLESLNTQLSTEHGHHLEVIVILLIVIEVFLDIMRWFNPPHHHPFDLPSRVAT